MIAGALVVPGALLQLPEYAGQTDPGAALRARSAAALRDLLEVASSPRRDALGDDGPDDGGLARVVVVAGAERAPRHTKGAAGVRIARVLLEEAAWRGAVTEITVEVDATPVEVEHAAARVRALLGRAVLLVPADGSATRTEKAPGFYDPRAEHFDEEVRRALANGDVQALAGLDPVVAEELWCTGRAAFQVLGRCFPDGVATAEVMWRDDPYGVEYLLARWTR